MENDQFEEGRLFFVRQMENLLRQGKPTEALLKAEARLAEFPLDTDALSLIHLTLLEMGKIEESLEILQRVEKEIGRLAVVYLRAADAYRDNGWNREAVLLYQKFLSLSPSAACSREVADKLAALQEADVLTGNVDQAEGEAMPRPEFYTITLADLYIRQGHLKMAADVLAEIIKKDPANIRAREKLEAINLSPAIKAGADVTASSADAIIKTLSCWLENIGRLKKNAT